MSKPLVSLRAAFDDPHLLGSVMGGPTRMAMRSLLLASQGERLTPEEREHWRRLTQRDREPGVRAESLHVYAGRRSGKTSGIAALVTYVACLQDHSDCLAPGETGVCLVIAENQRQARILFDYIYGVIDTSPALRKLIIGRTQQTLSLSNRVSIEVRSADWRGLRGLTLLSVAAEEVCHWRSADDSLSNVDTDIIDAVLPGLATTNGMFVSIGSPYAKNGFGYQTFKRDFGPNGDPEVIVANGATRDFNPTIKQRTIDRAVARDPQAAASEWMGQWRNDIDAFVNREVVEACVTPGCFERPFVPGQHYTAFVDPAGGSGQDSMTLAIAHVERNVAYVDAIREAKPPFHPDSTVDDFVSCARSYHVTFVTGDRWGGEFCRDQFKKRGMRYDISEMVKSDIYHELLPPLNSHRVDLLDNSKLINQLCNLERRVGRGTGKESIDHPRGNFHDDVANCCAGAIVMALNKKRGMHISPELLARAAERPAYVRQNMPAYMKQRMNV